MFTILLKTRKRQFSLFKKIGNAYNCILNKKVHPAIFEAEFKRRNNLLKKKFFKVLNDKLSKLNFPFIALIFGSYAKGRKLKLQI